MKGHQESVLQRACVAWFRRNYPDHALLLFAVPNGGGRSKVEAGIMKAEGVTAGVSDMILLMPNYYYHSLCIEFKCVKTYAEDGKFKTRKTYQSAEQKAWQAVAEDAGNKYAVVRSLDEFAELIEEYMRK